MIVFWMVAAALSAAAAGLVLVAARRAERRAGGENPSLETHRRQLGEIDELVARGLLGEDEREQARAEAGRRLLAVADRGPEPTRAGGRRLALVAAGIAPLLAIGLYLLVGSPGRDDAPFAGRVAAWRAADPGSLNTAQIAAVLGEVAKGRPSDPELLRNLALARQGAGDNFGAVRALRQAVAASPGDPALWTALGEGFVTLSDGQVGPDAQQAFREALKRDPKALVPRYNLAMASIVEGRTAEGLAVWRAILAELPPGDPSRAGLSNDIAMVEKNGGSPPAAPPSGAPPMTADGAPDIQAMVAGLAARLEAEPNDPAGWARLIRAYAVLGESAKHDAALAAARKQFKGRPDVLRRLDQASEAPQ
jgi:cytochrome c-type biogenesis protein CcmH